MFDRVGDQHESGSCGAVGGDAEAAVEAVTVCIRFVDGDDAAVEDEGPTVVGGDVADNMASEGTRSSGAEATPKRRPGCN